MSILLDALKKSEAQRQLGKTPNIHSTVEAPAAKRGLKQRWLSLSLLVLSAVAIAWFGWQKFHPPADVIDGSGTQVAAVSPVEESPVPANAPGQKNAGQEITPQEKAKRKKARQKARQEARQKARQEKADGGSTDRTPVESFTADNKGQAGTAKKPQANKEKLERSFNSYSADNDAEKATVSAKTAPLKTTAARTAGNVTKEAVQATPGESSARVAPHEAEPISFWQMPQSLRDGMPEFKISVLVYAENPQDRFLLINGQRLKEKEELDSGVVLDEIRPDRAVFHYRKYKFYVKG
jgi:general secretion pathway protein B